MEIKDKKYWEEELKKVKKSKAYFFENYVLINNKKPSEIQINRFKLFVEGDYEEYGGK